MNHKEMWKKVFGDTEKYVDYYFKEKAKRSVVYSKYVGHELASMAFFTPCRVWLRGNECVCPYVVGVATNPQYRGKGMMRSLLEQGLMDAKHQGAPLAFLSPANPEIYKSFGFESMYFRDRLEVTGHQKKWYTVSSFSRLDSNGKERAAEFAGSQLYASDIDLYMHRDVPYYEQLHLEMKALGGKVLVLREGAFVRAVAAYIHEEDFYEVTEVVCDPADGQRVLESICAFLEEDEKKQVIFADGYFLRDVRGDGIRIRRMDEPYLMVKRFGEEAKKASLRVYINDIT